MNDNDVFLMCLADFVLTYVYLGYDDDREEW